MKLSTAYAITSLLTLSKISQNGKYEVTAFTTPTTTTSCHSRPITAAIDRRTSFYRSSSSLRNKSQLSMSAPPAEETVSSNDMPQLTAEGLYFCENRAQYNALLSAHPNKIVILKFFAPWCRACKAMAPKFLQVSRDQKYEGLPIVWAELSVQNNKDFVKALGVLALPSVHIYAGQDGLVENFPCGPSKIPILKRKIVQVVNERVDAKTYELKTAGEVVDKEMDAAGMDCTGDMAESEPCKERKISTTEGDVVVTEAQLANLRSIPFFQDFDDGEFNGLIAKAKLVTFEPGSVIMKQGMPGNMFYVIASGEVEISLRTGLEDPLTTPPNYLGAVVNSLTENNYFGERAMITGEPRAASIKAVEKTRCFAFDQNDIPASSVLSGKITASNERIAEVNDKYGVDMSSMQDIEQSTQTRMANMANQVRGSANNSRKIIGVDTDDNAPEDVMLGPSTIPLPSTVDEDVIIPLLIRFKQARQVAKCFDYIQTTQLKWGDVGEVKRRSLLVSKLPKFQLEEFKEIFMIIDSSKDGLISLSEIKRFMESIGEDKTDEELNNIMNKSSPSSPSMLANPWLTFDEFMGIMAEAEFYYLFTETFKALEQQNSGFVRAQDLDRVLCGIRDLISNDRYSIIDVEDKDMLIDYEQFSKMLLGVH